MSVNYFLTGVGLGSNMAAFYYDQPAMKQYTQQTSFFGNAGTLTTIDIPDGAQSFTAFSNATARWTNDTDVLPTVDVGNRLFNVPRNVGIVDFTKPLHVFCATSGWNTFYWWSI